MLNFKITPIVTEKSTLDAKLGKYHFFVSDNMNKVEIAKEVAKQYGKEVATVHIIITREKHKNTARRGQPMVKRKSKKKAIVTFADKAPIDITKK